MIFAGLPWVVEPRPKQDEWREAVLEQCAPLRAEYTRSNVQWWPLRSERNHLVVLRWCEKAEPGARRSGKPEASERSRARAWAGSVDREAVCGLARFHQVPCHRASRSDGQRLRIRMSQTVSLDALVWLAEADIRGRRCEDQAERIDDALLPSTPPSMAAGCR